MKYFFLFCSLVVFQTRAQWFTEVSELVGMNYDYPGISKNDVGAGITVLDVNNDGWEDVFQPGGNFPSKLWLNKQGKFIDATADYGLDQFNHIFAQSAVSADYNNDGFDDLLIANIGLSFGDRGPLILLENKAGKKFERVMEDLFIETGNFPGATWADVNGDGWVDFYLLGYLKYMNTVYDTVQKRLIYDPTGLPNKLYINQGGEYFIDSTYAYGLQDLGCGLACTFTDFDNDGAQDLMLLNDFGAYSGFGNRLFKKLPNESKFVDVSHASGFYDEFYGMGMSSTDLNGDGRLDYAITDIGPNRLYVQTDSGFVDVASTWLPDNGWIQDTLKSTSWTPIFFDFDNDGFDDLFISRGFLESFEPYAMEDFNIFYQRKGDQFFNKTKESGLGYIGANRGAAIFDFDHDGDLDIVCNMLKKGRSEMRNRDQKIRLFRNNTSRKNNYLSIKLVGSSTSGTNAFGARIWVSSANHKQMREVQSTSGHVSPSSQYQHFGLGQDKNCTIQIRWPNGETQELNMSKVNQRVVIQQKE